MNRIVYYAVYSTAEENEKGIMHYKPWGNKAAAIKFCKTLPEADFMCVEKHAECYTNNGWEPNYALIDWNKRVWN